jgi:RNA polymerase sigma factor (sigma-70 family)
MQTDAELIDACRRGNELAWETLVRRYQRLIFAIPKRAGLDEDQAADVFQEVFATLFRRLDSIEDPNRLHAWLVTTARRKTWKSITKDKMWEQEADDDDESSDEFRNIPDAALLPDEQLLQLEQQHRIRTAVAGLDERCRRLLELLFYCDEPPPYDQIAMQLGTTAGSIGPTRARCLNKLLKSLEKL